MGTEGGGWGRLPPHLPQGCGQDSGRGRGGGTRQPQVPGSGLTPERLLLLT